MPTLNATLDLDAIAEHYLIAALWSSTDDDGDPLDDTYDTGDVADEAKAKAREDCADFVDLCTREGIDLAALPYRASDEFSHDSLIGHDFWLNRNGHGVGFWDRGFGAIGDKLSALAKTFGGCDPYVGDDGRVYLGD